MAIFRGRNEGILSVSLKVGDETPGSMHPGEGMIGERFGIANQGRAADKWLAEVVRWTWKVKLYTSLETDLLGELRDKAEDEAISVFARNLHDLLLAAPAGPRATLALDPGLRTGCKVAVVDATGKLLETATVYPHAPRNDWDGTLAILAKLCAKHAVDLIAIGNGTASRETDKLAGELIKKVPGLKLTKIMVSEAGASVFGLGARRPRIPGSGRLPARRRLHRPPPAGPAGRAGEDRPEVHRRRPVPARRVPAQAGAFAGCRGRDCVNAVGVDVNTASAALLARISGLNATLAQNIVQFRDANGAFKSRSELKRSRAWARRPSNRPPAFSA